MRATIIFLFSFWIALGAFPASFDCDSEFLKEAKELLASDHQDLLSKQFQLTSLKLSKKALDSKQNNLEALIRKYSNELAKSDQKSLFDLEKLYQKHGINSDYKKILENFQNASYWNKETRFYNQDVSMFILAKKTLDPSETELDNRDAAITWLAERLSSETGSKNSARFNLTNISTQVASISGALAGSPVKDLKKIETQIDELMAKIKDDFSSLKEDLSLSFKKNCFDEHGKVKSCKSEEDLFAMAIKELASEVGNNKIYQFSLESEVKNRFDGLVSFKIRTNLAEYAKQKAWLRKPPKKPFKAGFPYPGLEDYDQRKAWQKELNSMNDEEMIKSYLNQEGKGNYGILDKAKAVLTLYSKKGLLLSTISIKLKKPHQDSKEASGAGIYKIMESDGNLALLDQRGASAPLPLGEHAMECSGESCSEGDSPYSLIQKYLMPDGQLYILPYDGENNFEVKNSVLNLTTDSTEGPFFDKNFSPKHQKSYPIEIDITDHRFNTQTSREFVKALEDEKETIMKLYNLDNDEYNDLAKYSFGILGNESEFGDNWRYDLKEAFPFGVAVIKDTKKNIFEKTKDAYTKAKKEGGWFSGLKNGATTYFKELIKRDVRLLTGKITPKNNSRGPTQIKQIPDKIASHYGINKDNISGPKNAAVATMGFLAEAMVQLKNRAKKNPDITKENRLDYLHYIYMGSTHEIINRTATPDKNIYLRQLKEYIKGIKIYQKVAL